MWLQALYLGWKVQQWLYYSSPTPRVTTAGVESCRRTFLTRVLSYSIFNENSSHLAQLYTQCRRIIPVYLSKFSVPSARLSVFTVAPPAPPPSLRSGAHSFSCLLARCHSGQDHSSPALPCSSSVCPYYSSFFCPHFGSHSSKTGTYFLFKYLINRPQHPQRKKHITEFVSDPENPFHLLLLLRPTHCIITSLTRLPVELNLQDPFQLCQELHF